MLRKLLMQKCDCMSFFCALCIAYAARNKLLAPCLKHACYCRVDKGTVDTILSYCHNSLNDSSLLDLVPYLQEQGVGIVSASPMSMGLLTTKVGNKHTRPLIKNMLARSRQHVPPGPRKWWLPKRKNKRERETKSPIRANNQKCTHSC